MAGLTMFASQRLEILFKNVSQCQAKRMNTPKESLDASCAIKFFLCTPLVPTFPQIEKSPDFCLFSPFWL